MKTFVLVPAANNRAICVLCLYLQHLRVTGVGIGEEITMADSQVDSLGIPAGSVLCETKHCRTSHE